jgi:trk system potassium uptake protein TrkH
MPNQYDPPDINGRSSTRLKQSGEAAQGRVYQVPQLLTQPAPEARKNAFTLVVGFAVIILIGTVLLRLPIAGTQRPLTWEEAFFTSTSATTVTGLTVVTTATDLSLFGQLVVLALIEVGGVGFMSFAVVLFALIGRRVGIADRLLLQQSLGVLETVRVAKVALYVLGAVIAIQLVGAFLLWLRWWPALGLGPAAYQAIFHSVSAFNNAGFDLFAGTNTILFGYGRDPYTLIVLMLLITIGGLGVLVVLDLVTYPWDRRLMVYTKLTLVISAILTVGGFLILFIDEQYAGTTLAAMPTVDRFWVSLFNVVAARTAGLTIMPIDELSQGSKLVLMVLMFIGGAPASLAGGVTISTVGVLMVAVVSTIRGLPQAVVFGRVLPFETIAKAMAIMTVSTLLCFFVTLILLSINSENLFLMGFEVVSAFSNTGFSLGATPILSSAGRLLIAFTMFWGRLGPLTLVILLAQRERPALARYPSERIVMG